MSKPFIEKMQTEDYFHLFVEFQKSGQPSRIYICRLTNFAVGSSVLKSTHLDFLAKHALGRLTQTLSHPHRPNCESQMLVRGGTSHSGDAKTNERLAQQRAEAAVAALKIETATSTTKVMKAEDPDQRCVDIYCGTGGLEVRFGY